MLWMTSGFAILSLLVTLVSLFVVHGAIVPAVALACLQALTLGLAVWRASHAAGLRAGRVALACAGAAWLALEIAWLGSGVRFVHAAASAVALALAIAVVVADLRRGWRRGMRARSVMTGVVAAVIALACVPGCVLLVDADAGSRLMARGNDGPTATAAQSSVTRDDGVVVTSNVRYGETYPMSVLDVYRSPTASPDTATFVYVHGGGYVFGDKEFGDPTGEAGGFAFYLKSLCDAGYNVVSVDYAEAPEYRYPTPLRQLTQAVAYLQGHADELGLNMGAAVFAGGSAGGNIVGQFVDAQTNGAYAEQVGVPQLLAPDQIKAVCFNCALLDNARYSNVGTSLLDVLFDYPCDLLLRSYFGVNEPELTGLLDETSVIAHVTADFPPTYIDDGTRYTFDEQARDLAARLGQLGVDCELRIFEGEGHSFDTSAGEAAAQNVAAQIAFVDRYAKASS